MATPVTSPETQATLARMKYLLTRAGESTKISGLTSIVINQLSAAMMDVMDAEGLCLCWTSTFEAACKAMEGGQ